MNGAYICEKNSTSFCSSCIFYEMSYQLSKVPIVCLCWNWILRKHNVHISANTDWITALELLQRCEDDNWKIWSPHSRVAEDSSLLGYDTVIWQVVSNISKVLFSLQPSATTHPVTVSYPRRLQTSSVIMPTVWCSKLLWSIFLVSFKTCIFITNSWIYISCRLWCCDLTLHICHTNSVS